MFQQQPTTEIPSLMMIFFHIDAKQGLGDNSNRFWGQKGNSR